MGCTPTFVSNPLSHFHYAQWSPAYADVVFWFWFWFCINLLMLVSDVAWWVVATRLANRRMWRILVSAFMGGELVAHLSAMAGSDWPSSVMFRYWSGLYTRGRSQLVVSNGVGNWLPIRINAPAEIVHLTLRRAENRG
jgi:hypothetical protein